MILHFNVIFCWCHLLAHSLSMFNVILKKVCGIGGSWQTVEGTFNIHRIDYLCVLDCIEGHVSLAAGSC